LQHAEGERLGASSDAPLPNNEAAEEHFDGSQIRVENRQLSSSQTCESVCRRRDLGSKAATCRQANDQIFSESLPTPRATIGSGKNGLGLRQPDSVHPESADLACAMFRLELATAARK
jgi:hypothetical protein